MCFAREEDMCFSASKKKQVRTEVSNTAKKLQFVEYFSL